MTRRASAVVRMMAENESAGESSDEENFKGFGKKPAPRPKSQGQIEREKASMRYDSMQKAGMPEYNIWIRVPGADEKSWYPVGSLCVDRSSKIADAIYANEEGLLSGAFRLFPRLRKESEVFEYGYQLKEFPDEEIRVAAKPSATSNVIRDFFNKILSPLNLDDKK
eukprot:CAMPEP_0185833240 /NCGR_PEP_ID=MMETSP1353-20130828/2554_1 /TAXON_ID=1077150 /ORGANISM="Erythrolobus australicus, Strain CCMP3124" /LENGTH=165 /DNA_ID=CAMNT_0028531499 /DNA_START=154 /DNA_END=651 /DNA_ORIENTATION=-